MFKGAEFITHTILDMLSDVGNMLCMPLLAQPKNKPLK